MPVTLTPKLDIAGARAQTLKPTTPTNATPLTSTSTTTSAELGAGLDKLRAAFEKLVNHRGTDAVQTSTTPNASSIAARAARTSANAVGLDGSDALAVHDALMHASPAELNEALRTSSGDALSGYVNGLVEEEPFSIDTKGSALKDLALRVANDVTPDVGAALVDKLDDAGKRHFLEGVLQLDGADVSKLRAVIGDDSFATLARGGKAAGDSLVGGALVAGRLWKDNVTDEFKDKYQAALDGTLALPDKAKDTVFLTGPGLFGDELPGYLEPQRRALTDWGVPADNISKLSYNTADDPAVNADKIYQQIKAQHDQGKRVVVMGHSKFGRDMLEAFARHPDLKQMVSGAVMMQPAVVAPIAHDLGLPQMQKVLDPVLDLVGGNRAAFDGMSTPAEQLAPWPDDVPTMLYTSSTASPRAMMAASAHPYYEHFYNAESDGAVAFQDQVALNGAHLVTLPGLADHAQPGLTFTDACEHFAKQLDQGAPDAVVSGLLERMRAMSPLPKAFDAFVDLFKLVHEIPGQRARCAQMLRDLGPMLDRAAVVQNRNAGFPLVDNGAMTKALVSQLFDRMS
jgi:hypothetical protein